MDCWDVLKQAITKAMEKGYQPPSKFVLNPDVYCFIHTLDLTHCYHIIFNHEFAKAIWGEEDCWRTTKCTCGGAIHHILDAHFEMCDKYHAKRDYLYHLKAMVLEKQPLRYLEKFLE